MALTKTYVRLIVTDKDQTGPVDVQIECMISTDNTEAVAMGNSQRPVTLTCEAPRSAIGAFISACKVIDDGGWPTGAIPLPLPRKP